MATKFLEVVAAGEGWTQVRGDDGKLYKLEGARAWRNNNPGNVEYGKFAKAQGAIGSDGRFAVFPTYEQGRNAKATLMFQSPSYRDKSIEAAISRYAPSSENNTPAYIARVANAAGVPASTKVSDLSEPQRLAVIAAMEGVEGYRPGTVNGTRAELPAMSLQPSAPNPASVEDRVTARNREAINNQPAPSAPSASGTAQAVLPALPAPLAFPEMPRMTGTTPEERAAEQAAFREQMKTAFSAPRTAPTALGPMSLPGVSGSYSGDAMGRVPTTQGGPLNRGRPTLNPVTPQPIPSPPQPRTTGEGLIVRPVQTVAIDPATGMPRQASQPAPAQQATPMQRAQPLSFPMMESTFNTLTRMDEQNRRGQAELADMWPPYVGTQDSVQRLNANDVIGPAAKTLPPVARPVETGMVDNARVVVNKDNSQLLPQALSPVPAGPPPLPRPDPRIGRTAPVPAAPVAPKTATGVPYPAARISRTAPEQNPTRAPIPSPRPASRGGVPPPLPPVPRTMVAQAPKPRPVAPAATNPFLDFLLSKTLPGRVYGFLSGQTQPGQRQSVGRSMWGGFMQQQRAMPMAPRNASGRPIAAPGYMIGNATHGINAAGDVGDYGSQPGQITAGLQPGDRQYDPDTNSWGLR